MKRNKNASKGIGAILFLASMFSMAFNIIPLAAATEEVTELTIYNPDGRTISGSTLITGSGATVYWTFEIIDPNKVASPGETVDFRMRITNLPESDVPLELSFTGVSFNPGLSDTYGSWAWDDEWPTVPVGETYEVPFGHFSWTDDVPIGHVQGGSMDAGVYNGSPSSHSVPYSVTIIEELDKLDLLEAKLDVVDLKVDAIEAKLDGLEDPVDPTLALEALEAKADALEGKADALEVKLDRVEGAVADLAGKLQELVGAVADLSEQLAAAAERGDADRAAIESKLDLDLAGAAAERAAIESKLDNMTHRTLAPGQKSK